MGRTISPIRLVAIVNVGISAFYKGRNVVS